MRPRMYACTGNNLIIPCLNMNSRPRTPLKPEDILPGTCVRQASMSFWSMVTSLDSQRLYLSGDDSIAYLTMMHEEWEYHHPSFGLVNSWRPAYHEVFKEEQDKDPF